MSHPKTGLPCKVPERGWIYASYEEMQRQIKLGLVEFRDDHSQPPFRKAHICPISAEIDAEVDMDETDESDDEQLATQVGRIRYGGQLRQVDGIGDVVIRV